MNPSRRNFLLGRRLRAQPEDAARSGPPSPAQVQVRAEGRVVAAAARTEPVARIAETCLAWQNLVCRRCGDVCEPQAIRFRPRLGGAARPEVTDAACTGCGECVAACPVSAIRVVSDGVQPSATGAS